jgi:hypothetical protein
VGVHFIINVMFSYYWYNYLKKKLFPPVFLKDNNCKCVVWCHHMLELLKYHRRTTNTKQQKKTKVGYENSTKITTTRHQHASNLMQIPWGVHFIVKLNTTCDKKRISTFYIKDHQNRSKCFSFFFMSRYTQYLLCSEKL